MNILTPKQILGAWIKGRENAGNPVTKSEIDKIERDIVAGKYDNAALESFLARRRNNIAKENASLMEAFFI